MVFVHKGKNLHVSRHAIRTRCAVLSMGRDSASVGMDFSVMELLAQVKLFLILIIWIM